jgi:hypothetical protein
MDFWTHLLVGLGISVGGLLGFLALMWLVAEYVLPLPSGPEVTPVTTMSFTEIPAAGVKGFLLLNPHTNLYFFRVYDPDPGDGTPNKYTDYDLTAEDIEVELSSNYNALFKRDGQRRGALDFASTVSSKSSRLDPDKYTPCETCGK